MKRPWLLLVPAALAALTLLPARAEPDELDGEQILRRTDKDHRAKDERGVVDMVLVAQGDGQRQRRQMEMLFKSGEGEDDLHLLRFLDPPTIRGTALLTREASDREDDQWIYLPALKKSKKIASSKRTNRFAQTDFTYEDLRTEDFGHHTYKRLGDSKVEISPEEGTKDCYVVEARPKSQETSGYSKRVIYVDKDRFLTLKVEFYDLKDRHEKTLTNRGFEQVNGLWRAKMAMMEDLERGTKTLWRVTERQINPGLSDALFTVKSLERGI